MAKYAEAAFALELYRYAINWEFDKSCSFFAKKFDICQNEYYVTDISVLYYISTWSALMKIECPECGQHYEVDASMLDKHFRCTECKAFFLGINAKAVKVKKFVPKSSVSADADNAGEKDVEKTLSAVTPENKADEAVAAGNGEAQTEKSSDVVKLDPPKIADDDFLSDADIHDVSAQYSKTKRVIIAVVTGLTLFTAIISGAVAWGVGTFNGSKIAALEKRCSLLQEINTLQQSRIEKLEDAAAANDAKLAAGNEKSAKLEQKIAIVENNLKKINELAESVNKLESKDLELNVKILELNSVVNDLNNLIDSSERNGSRVQRRRR